MRIAYVIDSIDGWDGGGTEVQLRHLLGALDPHFFEPALFFLAPSKRMRDEEFPCRVYVAKPGLLPGVLSLVPDLARALREFRPHVVQTFFRDGTLCGTIAAKLARVRAIVQSERNLGYWMTGRDRVMQRCLRAMSDSLQCNSRTIYNWLRQTAPEAKDRIEILPNFLDLQWLSSPSEAERCKMRKQLGIPDRRPVLVSVANLVPVKDLLTLVRAAALVHAKLPEAHFVLIGEGPLREALIEEIKNLRLENVVSLLGSRPDVPLWLEAADLGLLTSTSEGCSNALLEYMGMGLPAVVSDIPANRELVDGAFFTVGNHSELAEQIISIWESRDRRDRLSADSQRRALQYSKAAFQERAQSFYVRIIAGAV
jgi:glycosyltransferase involved in cell wall biosynthesis